MQLLRVVLPLFLVVVASLKGGEFINLGFDEPDLSGRLVPLAQGGPYLGRANQIVLGWKVAANGIPVTEATYSPWIAGAGSGILDLQEGGPDYPYGNSLLIASVNAIDGTPGPDLWLSQTGTVPKDAVGLWVFGGSSIEAFVDGIKIGFIDPNLGRTVWNVEAFQGKTIELQIHSKSGHINRFDIIGFTTVPEPAEYAMFGVGLGLLGWQAWKRGGGRGSTHAPSSFADPV